MGEREGVKAEKRYRPDRPFFEAQESVSGGEAGEGDSIIPHASKLKKPV
jgi:hypothetical protein